MSTQSNTTTAPRWSPEDLVALGNRLRDARRWLDGVRGKPGQASLVRIPGESSSATPGAGEVWSLPGGGSVMLGREGDAPFAFPEDRKLSARHVRIERAGPGLWRAVDLDSRNGLWINDRRVTERWLVHGDRIHVGSQDFLFHDGTTETRRISDLLKRSWTTDPAGGQ